MEINKEIVAKVCGKEIKKEDVVNFANMLGPQPVSYTHLDVYKRQA